MSEITYRPYKESDLNFIIDSWLKSYYQNSEFAAAIDEKTFNVYHRAVIIRMLERGAKVLIACLTEDEDTILGFACYEAAILHYVFIKQSQRRQNLATVLLHRAEIANDTFYTHRTYVLMNLPKRNAYKYNPYLI